MKRIFSILFVLALVIAIVPTQIAWGASTVLVDNLQSSWTAAGGGGVYSGYYGPPDYVAVSPGTTAVYDGREAAPIMAGINIDTDGHYWDQCLYAFKPNMSIDQLAVSAISWDVEAQYGACPVWMYIEIDKGGANDTVFQFVPTSNPAGWHTVDAAAGLWQKWNNWDGDTTGNPLISLSQVAANYTGLAASRCYLNVGMGDAYHDNPSGTVDWVDKVTIGAITYDFVVPTYWYVATTGLDSNEGTLASPFLTIQHAVDSAGAGDTIHVAAGTYDEQVVITKSLTLQGAGDTTIVQPSSAARLTTVLDGLFWYGTPNTKNIAGIIVANVASGSPVTVKNLRVDESLVTTKPAGADYLAGVFYRETSGTVDTMSVVGGGNWSGWDRAFGIYLSAATNAVSVEVKGSSISNWDKNGIEVMGSELTANIHSNTLTGRGPLPSDDEVQNGVNVGRGATATINDNTISNLSWTAQQWWSAGILFDGASDCSANGNVITACQIGIIFVDNSGSAEGNTVNGGTVGLIGIWAQYAAGGAWDVSFVGNTVTGANDDTYYGYENAAIGVQSWDAGALVTATIDSNQVTGNAGTSADGILIGDVPAGSPAGDITVTITNNTVSGWQDGIRLLSSIASGSVITSNTITNNVGDGSGIHIEAGVDAANVGVNFNNIEGNEDYGVYNGGTGTLDATHNWWGDDSGPSGVGPGTGDAVSDNVTFEPWFGAGTGPGPATEETVTNGTVDARDEADTEVVVTGTATVDVIPYVGNPGGAPHGFTALGKYVDLYVPDTSGASSLEVRLYYTDDELPGGVIEESLRLSWWDGAAWVQCSDSGVNTASNYIWAVITSSTTPSLGDLESTPFGGGGLGAPTISTQGATNVQRHGATLLMNYTLGDFSPVQVRFAYKGSTALQWSYTGWVSEGAAGSHAADLVGLASSGYDFKAQLMYGDTLIEGNTLQFTTLPAGPCFIATAAYGTPAAEQIDVLREFRDVVLLQSTVGARFVALYYQFSPPVAEFIAGHEILRTLVRELLVDPIVWVVKATGDIWRS